MKTLTLCAAALTLAVLAGCSALDPSKATVLPVPGGVNVFIPNAEPATELAPLTANPVPAPALRTVEK